MLKDSGFGRCALGLVLALGTVAGISWAAPVSQESRQWADEVWTAARGGHAKTLEQLLATPPSDGIDIEAFEDFAIDVELWKQHDSDDDAFAETRLQQAGDEMFAAQAAGDLMESLRLLIEVQTLSEVLDAPLESPEVKALLEQAEKQALAWKDEDKIFFAHQTLYLLRGVYEDTSNWDAWSRLTEEYESLSDQLKLLRRYRFEDYHQRMSNYREARGDEFNTEYSPLLIDRWKEVVRDIDRTHVVRALRTADAEHVESQGLKPMLKGGIDALRLLAEIDSFTETFPGLADEQARIQWKAAMDACEAVLELPGVKVSLDPLLDRLEGANAASIQLPDAVLWREFTDGAMNELDRFSQVIWPYEFEQFQRQLQGTFVGVGVQIQETDLGEILVVSPLEGKPAFYAGVQADDVIVEVDGLSTAGWTVQDAVRHITGPEDTTVNLGIRREGEDELVQVPVTRAIIRMPTVKGWRKTGIDEDGREQWDWMVDADSGVGYIKLAGFDQETGPDLMNAVAQMRHEADLRGIVLDLRFNPGGLLSLAGYVSNMFIPRGEIVTGEDRDGQQTFAMDAHSVRCTLGGLPTVVLVNGGSASASEIVAGCLQAHGAAVVLGERSFGKGSVQTVHPIGAETRVKITNQYYRLPSCDGVTPGRLVHKRPGESDWGVVPDLIVPMSVDDVAASQRLMIRAERAVSALPIPDSVMTPSEDEEVNLADIGPPDVERLIADGFDPQLELAVLLIRSQVLAETPSVGEHGLPRVAGGEIGSLRSRIIGGAP